MDGPHLITLITKSTKIIMSTNTKLKIVAGMTAEERKVRPVFKQKLTPPKFGEALIDFTPTKHLAKVLDQLSKEDHANNSNH